MLLNVWDPKNRKQAKNAAEEEAGNQVESANH